jgi:cytochrome c
MKHYRLNQIAMAVLGALLLFFGAKTLINIAYEEHEPEQPGYVVPGTEEHPGGEVKPAGGDQLATLLASADPTRGADVAKKCAICHNFDKGGPNMIGPNLYGVLGRKVASHEGYEYSDALKAKGDETWDYEKINHMIENPGAYVPGTKMALFPGLPDAKQRADVLAFLRTKNDNPPPLPEAKPEATPSAETTPEAKPGEAAGGDAAFLELIAKADPKQGEADTGVCKVCHKFDKGGGTLMGPDLYGVVGRKIASVEGFNYTPALKAHEGDWTYEKLDSWLKNPQAFAPGTAMAFPGVADDKKRAAIVAFLRTNAETPVPLPEAAAATPPAAPAAEPAAPPAETPAPPSAETPAPSAATPAPPAAETPAPAAETPAPPAAETPAPSAETPAPPAETPAPPAAETPPPSAETPSAETPAPPAETPAPPAAETPAPSAETPSAETPSAETPAPPAAEEPAATEPVVPKSIEKVIEETEDNLPSQSSTGEPPSPNQPQPAYPEGKPEGVE